MQRCAKCTSSFCEEVSLIFQPKLIKESYMGMKVDINTWGMYYMVKDSKTEILESQGGLSLDWLTVRTDQHANYQPSV